MPTIDQPQPEKKNEKKDVTPVEASIVAGLAQAQEQAKLRQELVAKKKEDALAIEKAAIRPEPVPEEKPGEKRSVAGDTSAAAQPSGGPGTLPKDHKAWKVVYPNGDTGIVTEEQWETFDRRGAKRVDESGKPLPEDDVTSAFVQVVMRLVLVVCLVGSLGCAVRSTGEFVMGPQAPVPMTEMAALVESLRATVYELEKTSDVTKRRELALRAMDMVKLIDLRLHDILR